MPKDECLLSSLPQYATGLPTIVQIQIRNIEPNLPRIYFQNSRADRFDKSGFIAVSLSEEPEVLSSEKIKITPEEVEQIKSWVRQNRELLLKHWNLKITSYEVDCNQKQI